MRLLLDTHVWIWWRSDLGRLNSRVRRYLEDEETALFFSAASAWEIALKAARGSLKLAEPLDTFLISRLREDGIEEVPVTFQHAVVSSAVGRGVRDPFDRLLIAQARCEELTLVTSDRAILKSGVRALRAN